MATRHIHITEGDMLRLRQLLGARARGAALDQEHLESLAQELDRAIVVSEAESPRDVVGMGTRVRVRDLDSGETKDYTIVYPWEADVESNKVSVLAPLGTALLGYRVGDEIEWRMPGGVRRLRIEEFLAQPEPQREHAA
jgi:regulator of nucleoside diphosphate kinase